MAGIGEKIIRRALTGRFIPLPRHLTVEITSFCNLHCKMCPKTNHAVNTVENNVMSREVFEKLKPLFPHIESLELNGLWGEAFMHPELYLYMLREIKAHKVDVYTISNGTLLDGFLARQLVELDLNRLVVSLDAATPETYAKIRPPGHFEDVVQGLEQLKEWKTRLNWPHPQLELAFVGMRSNIDEFPDFVRLAHRLGAFQVFLQAMGEYESVKGESVAGHFKELGRRRFEEGRKIGQELGVIVNLLPGDQFEEDRADRNFTPDFRCLRKECLDLWNKAVIATNGDVLPCCSSAMSLGNLSRQSFHEVWYGKAYSELRRRLLGGDPPEMCRVCTGMPWVEKSVKRDVQFYISDLFYARFKRRVRLSPLLRPLKPLVRAIRQRAR